MLTHLRIQNIVLIEKLEIAFHSGLCTLTGETGAGKSILLDSLGLATGARADSALVRNGSDQASVTAIFDIPDDHIAMTWLMDQGLECESPLMLRRVLKADGKSRAFINDQPVSAGLLKAIGQSVLEIHGQFDTQGLLDPKTHLGLLDEYAGIKDVLSPLWNAWKTAEKTLVNLRAAAASSAEHEAYLRQSLEDLDALEPRSGEEETLANLRESLMNREQVLEALNAAYHILNDDNDPVRAAAGALDRVNGKLGSAGEEALAALDRASAEISEALLAIQNASSALENSEHNLETIDDRLFALRTQARKHNCTVDDLAAKRDALASDLNDIEHADEALEEATRNVEAEKMKYYEAALRVSKKRQSAAQKLDGLVAKELPPLKLERAIFKTQIDAVDETNWEASSKKSGLDTVQFMVSTNGSGPFTPLNGSASGGELSRFMLALKVVMARIGSADTLIFDEVDAGIGGATADAVGERLAMLSDEKQVLVVTHSPQVAARGDHHYIVSKSGGADVHTSITAIDTQNARSEEIARMLSGAVITAEARAAADKLLENRAMAC